MRSFVFENEINKLGTVMESVVHPGPGWLECDGKSYPRSDYPHLADLIPHPGLKYSTYDVSSQLTEVPAWYYSLLVSTDTTLFLMFSSGKYYRSTDAGVTWISHTTSFDLRFRTLYKLTTGRLILAPSAQGVPIYSDDDGITWTQSFNMPVSPPLCIYCVWNDVLYMMKQGDTHLYRTADLVNWNTLPLNLTNWPPNSGYFWSSMMTLPYDEQGVDFLVTVSDSDLGLDIYSYDLGVTWDISVIPLPAKYVNQWYIIQEPEIIDRGLIEGQPTRDFIYLNDSNSSVYKLDMWSWTPLKLAEIPYLTVWSNDVRVIDNNKIIAFSNDYSSNLVLIPHISYDCKTFNDNYGVTLPRHRQNFTLFNNKIYYFFDQDEDDIHDTLAIVEFDSSLFSVPGITPKGDLKSYISTGQ